MATAYVPLATLTLGGSAASVTFSSINQSYKDLVIVFEGKTAASNASRITFNGDTGANYWSARLESYASSASASNDSSLTYHKMSQFANNLGTVSTNFLVNIMDYTSTNKYKSLLASTAKGSQSGGGGRQTSIQSGSWRSTAAVTSITVFTLSTFSAGSTFSLYGIAG